ncbi:hypothetical protein L195_g056470, partial [Trifolium pratense]
RSMSLTSYFLSIAERSLMATASYASPYLHWSWDVEVTALKLSLGFLSCIIDIELLDILKSYLWVALFINQLVKPMLLNSSVNS